MLEHYSPDVMANIVVQKLKEIEAGISNTDL